MRVPRSKDVRAVKIAKWPGLKPSQVKEATRYAGHQWPQIRDGKTKQKQARRKYRQTVTKYLRLDMSDARMDLLLHLILYVYKQDISMAAKYKYISQNSKTFSK